MHGNHHVCVLVEDDQQVRRGVQRLLQEALPGHKIEAFSAGKPAVEFCQREEVELLLTDLGLPDMNGLDVIRAVRTRGHVAHIIVMTGAPTDDLPRELWELNVAGFIDKTSLYDHVSVAIKRVRAGGMYFSAQVTPARLAADATGSVMTVTAVDLTPRERDVARLVATGLLSKEIADQLHLSPRTVEKHRARVMRKVGVRSAPQLVYWCLRQGLV